MPDDTRQNTQAVATGSDAKATRRRIVDMTEQSMHEEQLQQHLHPTRRIDAPRTLADKLRAERNNIAFGAALTITLASTMLIAIGSPHMSNLIEESFAAEMPQETSSFVNETLPNTPYMYLTANGDDIQTRIAADAHIAKRRIEAIKAADNAITEWSQWLGDDDKAALEATAANANTARSDEELDVLVKTVEDIAQRGADAKRTEEERIAAEEEAARQAAEEEAARQAESNGRNSSGDSTSNASYSWDGSVLTPSKGVNWGPTGKESYYNLDMSLCVAWAKEAGVPGEYWVRDDGVKMLGDYVMVAANLDYHPRYSQVATSLGMGIVVDTGGFAYMENGDHWLDIAVTW